ncbi:MAG: ABC transporter permease [Sporichthyaceae bacterium]
MDWAWDERRRLAELVGEHAYLAFVPVLVGLGVALPLGLLVGRSRRARGPLLVVCAFVHAVPALTFFVLLPALLDTRLDSDVNVLIGLSLFTSAVLTRAVGEGLREVPDPVRWAAESMGMSPLARLVRVDFPAAAPTVIAGLRSVVVSCVTLVTVAALVGVGGLGELFTEGYSIRFETEVLVGGVLVVAMAAGADIALVRLSRTFLPWARMVVPR